MSFQSVAYVSILLVAACSQFGHAQEKAAASPSVEKASDISADARMIINQYITATGGREAWSSLESVQGNGTVSIPAASISGTAAFCITPDTYRNTFNMSGGKIKDATIITGRNGDVVWQLTGESEQYQGKIMEGVERLKSLRKYQFNQMLDLDANFLRVELADVEEVNGKSAYKLDMVPRESPESTETRYFDQATHLIVRTVIEGGGPLQESFYGNYVQVGPVKMHTKTTRMAGGVVLMEINMTDLLVNKPFPDKDKKMPYEIRVLLGEETVSPPGGKSSSDAK